MFGFGFYCFVLNKEEAPGQLKPAQLLFADQTYAAMGLTLKLLP